MRRPKYHFYATLLDSFAWYKRSEDPGAKQEFIDRVNRVQKPKEPPQLRGIAFNDIVDRAAKSGLPGNVETIKVHDIKCPLHIVERFVDGMQDALRQVYTETTVETMYGPIRVYGFVDELLGDTAYEIKTVGQYEFPKYLHAWQHPVYLQALRDNRCRVDRFVYRVTDFKNIYEEEYAYRPSDTDRLADECAHLAEFLESSREQITDRKVFGL